MKGKTGLKLTMVKDVFRPLVAVVISLAALSAVADPATQNPERLTSQLGILTPPVAKAPRINGPRVYGVRPGRPILYRVPVTGEKVEVGLEGLEGLGGLEFDPKTRVLSGAIAKKGEYRLRIVAKNEFGTDEKPFTIKVGDKIALTPPMGFNSWNYVGDHPSDAMMRKAADAMIARGLADHGYQYVNVDDCWQQLNRANCPWRWKDGKKPENPPPVVERDETGRIIPQKAFPDMKALADYIHAKGLKCGLYSSPGDYTCAGATGSWKHEYRDAGTWAEWGFDYVKYDLCSYSFKKMAYGPSQRMKAMIPYLLMGKALREQKRDIVLSICQYGLDDVPVWGERAYGQCWRTTGDVWDNWEKVRAAIARQEDNWYYSGPGAWNDPDMLVVKSTVKTTSLTPNEQYTHISMWAMVAAPLMIGCDMAALDDFTLALLTNDEVIDIDQDELGKGAAFIARCDGAEVWARPLADGSAALAFFNAGDAERELAFALKDLGLEGRWAFRDVWRQRDIGVVEGRWTTTIPGHATTLVRVRPSGGHYREGLDDIRDLSWLRYVAERRPVK